MEISDNKKIITNGYPIFEWAPGVPILDDDEGENEISNATEQVAYDVHVDTYDEDDKYDKDTGKVDKSDDHDDGYDNKELDETKEQRQPLVDIQDRYGINM